MPHPFGAAQTVLGTSWPKNSSGCKDSQRLNPYIVELVPCPSDVRQMVNHMVVLENMSASGECAH